MPPYVISIEQFLCVCKWGGDLFLCLERRFFGTIYGVKEKIKGIIKKYYNSEVLSIFLELLNVYESKKQEKLLPLQNACRLTELYQELYMLEEHSKGIKEYEHNDLIEASKYTESIFKAYGLFTEYLLGSNALKKYILNSKHYVQVVITPSKTLTYTEFKKNKDYMNNLYFLMNIVLITYLQEHSHLSNSL